MRRIQSFALALLLLVGCQNPALWNRPAGGNSRSLTVSWTVGNALARTILPASYPAPVTYDVTLTPSSGPIVSQTALAATSWTFGGLQASVYTIVIVGKDGGGNVVVNGTSSVDLTVTSSSSPSVTLSYLSSGGGVGQINLTFNTTGSAVTGTSLILVDPSGMTIFDGALSGTAPVFTYSNGSAPVGSYKLFATFSTATTTALKAETVLVVQNVATTATISVVPGDFSNISTLVTALVTAFNPAWPVNRNLGQTAQLSAVPNGSNPLVRWSSSSPGVASVDQSGLVSTFALGTALITAVSVENPLGSAVWTVNVNPVPPPFRVASSIYGGVFWSTTDFGATWSSGGSSANWTTLTGSVDGTQLLASQGAYVTNSYLYRSSDGGLNWSTLSAPFVPYNGEAMSDNGAILAGVEYVGTLGTGSAPLEYSTDSGTTWNLSSIPIPTTYFGYFGGLSSSSDGHKWVTENGGDSSSNVYMWTGTFDGVSVWNWTQTGLGYSTHTPHANPVVAPQLSKDGTKILAAFSNDIHLSPDFGATWPTINNPPFTTGINNAALSGNGSVIAAVCDSTSLYVTSNAGTTWIPASFTPAIVSPAAILSLSVSYDGSRMVVATSNNPGTPLPGYVYVSNNGGASFAQMTGPATAGLARWNNVFVQPQ